jgi:hypothetical protein
MINENININILIANPYVKSHKLASDKVVYNMNSYLSITTHHSYYLSFTSKLIWE